MSSYLPSINGEPTPTTIFHPPIPFPIEPSASFYLTAKINFSCKNAHLINAPFPFVGQILAAPTPIWSSFKMEIFNKNQSEHPCNELCIGNFG
jgi:hypothetical protein